MYSCSNTLRVRESKKLVINTCPHKLWCQWQKFMGGGGRDYEKEEKDYKKRYLPFDDSPGVYLCFFSRKEPKRLKVQMSKEGAI